PRHLGPPRRRHTSSDPVRARRHAPGVALSGSGYLRGHDRKGPSMNYRTLLIALPCALSLVPCPQPPPSTTPTPPAAPPAAPAAPEGPAPNPDNDVYFGDVHVH